jgi:hypothetical protein
MGLIPDEPCKFIPLDEILEIKRKYDEEKFESFPIHTKVQLAEEIEEMLSSAKDLTKEDIAEIEGKQIEPYMREINAKMKTQDLHVSINKLFGFMGIDKNYVFNVKNKNNSFFYRSRVSVAIYSTSLTGASRSRR